MSDKSSTFAPEIGNGCKHSSGEADGAPLGSDLEGIAGRKTHTADVRTERATPLPISGVALSLLYYAQQVRRILANHL